MYSEKSPNAKNTLLQKGYKSTCFCIVQPKNLTIQYLEKKNIKNKIKCIKIHIIIVVTSLNFIVNLIIKQISLIQFLNTK